MKRRQLISLLALTVAVAAIVPTFAQAKPSPSMANDRAHYGNPQADDPQYLLGPGEIPYLSQGVGVNEENFRGSASTTQKRVEIPYLSQGIGVNEENFGGSVSTTQKRVEIPYLSQGVGVTSSELFGVAADDRAHSRATSVETAPIVVTEDSGWSVDFGNSAVAGLALMLGLLAGGAGVAIWQSRKTKLSPA
jgi:hypothetical protein